MCTLSNTCDVTNNNNVSDESVWIVGMTGGEGGVGCVRGRREKTVTKMATAGLNLDRTK